MYCRCVSTIYRNAVLDLVVHIEKYHWYLSYGWRVVCIVSFFFLRNVCRIYQKPLKSYPGILSWIEEEVNVS